MTSPLLARLSKAGRHQLSLRPGRTGWLVTSPFSLATLRESLRPWCRRICVVHEPSGRFFMQPNRRYLARVLGQLGPIAGNEFHHCPVRGERLRRLEPYLDGSQAAQLLGMNLFISLALRLEAISVQEEAGALWKHMATDFDALWQTVPLFAVGLEPWQSQVLRLLCGPVSSTQEPGTVSSKEF